MEEFRFIQPSPILIPYVKQYWLLKTAGDSTAKERTVPTGMMSLLFHRGTQLLAVQENEFHPKVFLNGYENTFADLAYSGQVNMISVVFHPVGVRAFFNLPMQKIKGLRVTAGDMEDKELKELEKAVTSTEDDRTCVFLIEQFLIQRLRNLAGHNLKRVETSIKLINSGHTDVVSLAGSACLSPKQFKRVFSEYIGANPKEFSRIIRFQRTLHTLEAHQEINLTALTYECGYYDQSHLIKDFKALSGYTPGEYLAACSPHSDYFD